MNAFQRRECVLDEIRTANTHLTHFNDSQGHPFECYSDVVEYLKETKLLASKLEECIEEMEECGER